MEERNRRCYSDPDPSLVRRPTNACYLRPFIRELHARLACLEDLEPRLVTNDLLALSRESWRSHHHVPIMGHVRRQLLGVDVARQHHAVHELTSMRSSRMRAPALLADDVHCSVHHVDSDF